MKYIEATTYYGGDAVEIDKEELVLIDRKYLDGDALPPTLPTEEFLEASDIVDSQIAAYMGAFGEFVPVVFE